MSEYFFIVPVVFGWLMFLSAVFQYVFYRKNNRYSKKYSAIFVVFCVLWVVSSVVWAIFRNL